MIINASGFSLGAKSKGDGTGMARNQGGYTVVLKRSRRVFDKAGSARSSSNPAIETTTAAAPRGWADAAATGMAGTAPDAGEVFVSEARRAAEKLFAPRKAAEKRVLAPIAATSTTSNGATPRTAVEPGAPAIPRAAERIDIRPSTAYEAADPLPEPIRERLPSDLAVTGPSLSLRHGKTSPFDGALFPPGQRWLRSLPESCWPPAVRLSVRQNRRRAARSAARAAAPVQ